MDKTIKISKEACKKIKTLAKLERRTIKAVVDIKFGVFKEKLNKRRG